MIYKQHETAFKGVSAYVIASPTGERVATIAFKYAASGLRTTCYMHWLGSPMVKGIASGGGYDKASAAAWEAAKRLDLRPDHLFKAAIKDQGRHWDQDLKAAGFNVLQAV
jgi:hypothetical protein